MLYRPQALAQLDSPDELQALMRITDARGWLFLAGLGLVSAGFFLWTLLGTVAVQVEGRGILLTEQGLHNVYAPAEGVLETWLVRPGDSVRAGQAVAHLVPDDGAETPREVLTRTDGQVLELLAESFSLVKRGEPLLSLGDADSDLHAVLFLPSYVGAQVRPGMAALLEPTTGAEERNGLILGTVERVAAYPSSLRGMVGVLDNPELAREIAVKGAPIEIRVRLEEDPSSPDGYRWTSRAPVGVKLQVGTLCQGRVILREQHPYQLVLGGGG